MAATKGCGFSMKRGIQWPFCLADGQFLVLICSENKIRLAGGCFVLREKWWLISQINSLITTFDYLS
jgi:hypothetical protein